MNWAEMNWGAEPPAAAEGFRAPPMIRRAIRRQPGRRFG
jgi:hypothetical protein